MKPFLKRIFPFWPILALLIFEIFLFKKNYVEGTWLIGWDSTQPELNLKVSFIRNLNAVWQEYRGLGLLDGMAHAANLIHTFYISILALFLPRNLIRYAFVFLMHFLGGVGTYFLGAKIFSFAGEYRKKILGLISAFFYLLNLGSIQMFFTPFEAFAVHFAFLPWLILSLISYLETGTKRNLLLFSLVTLLAAPQAHIPTLFIVYAFSAAIVIIVDLFSSELGHLKRGLLVIAISIALNGFWGFPYVYSAIKNAPVISNAKINILSNPEIVLRNRAFGDFKDVALIRGFSLDYQDWGEGDKYGLQMALWKDYLYKPEIEKVGLALFGLALLGFCYSLLRRRHLLPFSIIFFFSFANLATEFPLLAPTRPLLEKLIPYYSDIFRFSFTKFVTVYSLSLAILLAGGAYLLGKLIKPKLFTTTLGIILVGGIVYMSLPALRGHFFYDRLKLLLPQEYFETFRFFDQQADSSRVAIMPQPIFWGWEYLRWGYRGSGFIWQGVKNPILHRSFDAWNAQNESYYNELSRAYYLKDSQALDRIYAKYQIGWILLDENIFLPGGWDESEYISWYKDYLENSGHFTKEAAFGEISVYKNIAGGESPVFAPSNYLGIDADLTYSQEDKIYEQDNDYYSNVDASSYPFINFDARARVKVEENGNSLHILSAPFVFAGGKEIVVPQGLPEEIVLATTPDGRVEATFPIKNKTSEDFSKNNGLKEALNCDILGTGKVTKQNLGDGIIYSASDGGISCDFFDYPNLSYNQGYALHLLGKNKQGRSLKIYLRNTQLKRIELEQLLPEGDFDKYYFILPKALEGEGYSLNLETRSFGLIPSTNLVKNIEFIPVPLNWLTQTRLTAGGKESSIQNNLSVKGVKKIGTFAYMVDVERDGLLVLSSGYENGWGAYLFSNGKWSRVSMNALEHVKVNSWENGWFVPGDGKVLIFFWPQILEFLGIAVGLFALTSLLKKT